MSASTLSSDSYALLATLQLQRVASTHLLQDQLAMGHALIDKLTPLQDAGLVRLRGEQQWSLTAEGTLALILGVRAGLCPAPDWSRVPSLTGQDLTHAVVRELCRGKAGEIPTYFSASDLLDLARCPGRSPVAGGLQPRLAATAAGALLAATLARCPL